MSAFNGINGSLLFSLESNNLENQFGRAVCGLGDLDGDGVAEFAVGAPHEDGIATNGGRALFYRGATTYDCGLQWKGPKVAGSTASLEILGSPTADLLLLGDSAPGPTPVPPWGTVALGLTSGMAVLGDTLGLLGPPIGARFDGQGFNQYGPTTVPPVLSGATVYLQAFSITPLAPNGTFQRSPGLAILIL